MRFAILLILCVTAQGAFASCRFTRDIDYRFPTAALKHFSVNALAGKLDITGNSGHDIVFKGTACTDKQRFLDRMTVEVEQQPGRLTLSVVIPSREPDFTPDTAYIDVEISMPKDLPISVKDTSGDIRIRNASVERIDDGSGDIHIREGHADLSIEDSSGEIDIAGLDHGLTVVDSSGSISARGIGGSVSIPRDSSGDIALRNVNGSVDINRDSSGGILVTHVAKDVEIGSDGSGDIEISDVGGSVTIGADGSGYVSISGVKGDATLKAKGSGKVNMSHVSGTVSMPRRDR